MAIACDTGSLLSLASCFNCLSVPQQLAIQTYLLCQISSGSGTTFVSTGTAFSATTQFTFAHGLNGVPSMVRAVMVNQSTDQGYTTGQEVDIRGVFHTASGTEWTSVYADGTNVYIAFREGSPAAANIRLMPAAGGVPVTGPDVTKWTFKIYARL